MASRALVAFVCFCAIHSSVYAQRAGNNAVTAAEDAFGATLGEEAIGLYGASQVRGFSPVVAGNVRIEGLYFDRRASLSTRLVEGSTVRVGISSQGYPFPAPTGIVDYRLQKVADEGVVSVAAGFNPYLAPAVEVDAKLPIVANRFGIAAGLSYAHEEYYDGANAHYVRAAVIPRWRLHEHVEVIPFWALTRGRDEEVAPTIVTSANHAPPEIARRSYFGQSWADAESDSATYGVIAKARIGSEWALAAGVFRSEVHNLQDFAEVYVDTRADGLTRELVVADPPQYLASTSGEWRLSRSFSGASTLHVLHASLRARNQDSRYGGSAPALDLGWRKLGERTPIERPASFAFRERIVDTVRQWAAGLMYEGRWRNVGEATFGVQRTAYDKTVQQPGLAQVESRDTPTLVVGTFAAHLSPTLALYGGYTQGLEESGIAPDSAANRNELLPAIRTRQADVGIRWAIRPELKLVAGLFEVKKPYLALDERSYFTSLGDVTHRGFELSFSGRFRERLNLVAGAVLLEPRVAGEAVDLGRVGDRAIGQSDRVVRVNVDYRFAGVPALSLDAGLANFGKRVASNDNSLVLPSYTLIDIGLRYRTRVGRAPATLRLQAQNITNEFAWNVFAANSFGLMDARRYSATLFVDF